MVGPSHHPIYLMIQRSSTTLLSKEMRDATLGDNNVMAYNIIAQTTAVGVTFYTILFINRWPTSRAKIPMSCRLYTTAAYTRLSRSMNNPFGPMFAMLNIVELSTALKYTGAVVQPRSQRRNKQYNARAQYCPRS
eukprot:GHVU01035430.1.p1 GENE.GHVU01035430.1~~GHVU01035430.1.p1  ORF type:complete len:135 (-),score=4.64 GHVU01035430.1:94-498(-)